MKLFKRQFFWLNFLITMFLLDFDLCKWFLYLLNPQGPVVVDHDDKVERHGYQTQKDVGHRKVNDQDLLRWVCNLKEKLRKS